MGRKYKNDDIISLNAREFTRLRPSTYLGSNEYSTQLLREIFSNSLDEHCAGHGTKIDVSISTFDNIQTISVEDNGQGFPIDVIRKEDGKSVFEAALSVINTSGKYTEDGCYSGSLGCNGIGAKLTTYLSSWLVATTWNNNKFEKLTFKDGLLTNREVGEEKHNNGTKITWEPDGQFFQNQGVDINALRKLFRDVSALCPDLSIHFNVDNNVEIFESKNGLLDALNDVVEDTEVLSSRFITKRIVDNSMLDIAMTYTTSYSEIVKPYVNFGLTESGIHVSTVKALLTKHLNKFALENKLIKKESDYFTPSEFTEGLVLIFNIKCPNVKYDSQTKTRVVDINRQIINDTINADFPVWLNNNSKDAKIIIDRALMARKAKEAAKNARDRIRDAKNKSNKFLNLPTKLVDAWSKNREECECLLCEGDSAASGLIAKRDGKVQAVFPLRGKIISCSKTSADKVYANQEINNIVKGLGLDIDKNTNRLIYDKKKLRYGKLILCTDMDPDGQGHIRLLLITALNWLCPDLIKNGHVYVAEPPLYRITTKKNQYVFLKNDRELDNYKKKHSKEILVINRNKGLGEQDPDELAQCVLRPETRNLVKLTVEDMKYFESMLDMFMGNDVTERRKFLLENS